jgi:mannose-6-phosphate isomerase-like protein (cupin superfamily)
MPARRVRPGRAWPRPTSRAGAREDAAHTHGSPRADAGARASSRPRAIPAAASSISGRIASRPARPPTRRPSRRRAGARPARRGRPPLHMHRSHDEGFYVLSGEIALFMPGGHEVALEPGDFFLAPRGVPHVYRVSGSGPASWLVTSGPKHMDSFVAAVCALDDQTPEAVTAVAAEHDVEILGPPGPMPSGVRPSRAPRAGARARRRAPSRAARRSAPGAARRTPPGCARPLRRPSRSPGGRTGRGPPP